jgi:transcriptional regulator with XRE-family HTH domain
MTRALRTFRPEPEAPITRVLRAYRTKVHKSQADISRDSWLDESYVSRLFSGERHNPSRDALILLGGWGLQLPIEDMDEVLLAADYKPLVLPQTLR